MAAGSSRSSNGAITGINVTPLVDITLVLLIIFMVTAKLVVANKDLRAVIQAEGAVPHRTVMHILDLLRQAGVAKVGFGVVKE